MLWEEAKRTGVIPALLAHSNRSGGGQASSTGCCHLELKSSLALLSDGDLFDGHQATELL